MDGDIHSFSTASSTGIPPLWLLAGAVLGLMLLGIRSWFLLHGRPMRSTGSRTLFHLIRFGAAACLIVVVVLGLRSGDWGV